MSEDQGGMRLTRRELMTRGATGAAAGLLLGRLAWAQAPEAAVHTLPAQVDAAREAPAVQIGLSRVVASPLGAYREAGANYNDRMAYLFEASAVGKLLRLTLSYPGDKPRLGELFLLVDSTLHWSLNALGTGYFTGLPHALTGGMITQSCYFYAPVCKRFAIVLMTSKAGAPAAAATLKVEEVGENEQLPRWPAEMSAPRRRRLGIYSEDPVLVSNFGGDLAKQRTPREFGMILDRQVAYLKRIGHTQVIYPVVWYLGALYQPSKEFAGKTTFDRPHPEDYDKLMARRYSQDGIEFWPSIRNWHLPSLAPWLKSAQEVSAGAADYVNAVSAQGKVMVAGGGGRWHSSPLLNAFHPRVRPAMKELVGEVMDRVGAEPSVPGVALFTTIHSSHGLGTIDQSYDDLTLSQFSADCSVGLPKLSGPYEGRFAQWHDWLRQEHWQEWLRWRRDRQTAIYAELANVVTRKKPGAKLHLMILYPIPTMTAGLTVDDVGAYLNEVGLDLEALGKNPAIVISRLQLSGTYQGQLRSRAESTPVMQTLAARARLEFDPAWQRPFLGRTAGCVIQYTYFEHAWNREPRLRLPAGWKGGEPAWHVTSPKGGGRAALEYITRALALYDAQFITHGGFQVGPQGMEDLLQPLSASFASLPAAPFATVRDADGVVVRSALVDGSRWLYAVNGSDQPREVTLRFSAGGKLHRLGLHPEEIAVTANQPLHFKLAPFDLIACRGEGVGELKA